VQGDSGGNELLVFTAGVADILADQDAEALFHVVLTNTFSLLPLYRPGKFREIYTLTRFQNIVHLPEF
jgi:hypothetical protein